MSNPPTQCWVTRCVIAMLGPSPNPFLRVTKNAIREGGGVVRWGPAAEGCSKPTTPQKSEGGCNREGGASLLLKTVRFGSLSKGRETRAELLMRNRESSACGQGCITPVEGRTPPAGRCALAVSHVFLGLWKGTQNARFPATGSPPSLLQAVLKYFGVCRLALFQ